ncbi:MAG: hypothetical protein IIZ12_01385 [Eggerthellaceae bacterium]|nr:hypothetical protein [Eggerthellaceae bacterium]
MAVLIAPNGVIVNASEQDTPILLAAGYTRADEKQKAEKPKRATTRKKSTIKE